MAMAQATLAAELQNLTPVITEAEAIANWVDAYGAFAAEAEAATPILEDGIDLGKDAMATAMVGMSADGQASTKIEAGIQAFWGAVATGLTSSFAGATAITPPPHAGLKGALDSTFLANTSGAVSLEDATDAIATVLHGLAIVGGTVTTPGPTVTPIS